MDKFHAPSFDHLENTAWELIRESLDDPWGEISPSLYDTARTVALLPHSLRPTESISFLLARQCNDGSWGWHTPVSYRLVPTLAVTNALLQVALEAIQEKQRTTEAATLVRAARQGLVFLSRALHEYDPLPDTIAIELILPALLEEIDAILQGLKKERPTLTGVVPSAFLDDLDTCIGIRLPLVDRKQLEQIRLAARLGRPLPVQMNHCLEVLDGLSSSIPYEAENIFGGSPCATAARITNTSLETERSIVRLTAVAMRFSGAFPVTYPITIYERSWVVFYLLHAGMMSPEHLKQHPIISYLQRHLGPHGLGYAEGLFPDCDDTSVVLAILAQLGTAPDLACLRSYEVATHFCCYPDERTPSVGVNAHVLNALCVYIQSRRRPDDRTIAAIRKCTAYLLAEQDLNGSWLDKWHASPYYATACCVEALQHIKTKATEEAIQRATTWILNSQRSDGSWGYWSGTLEETAHALHALLDSALTIPQLSVARGIQFLLLHENAAQESPAHTPLWHGKELYEPYRISKAIVLSALYRGIRYMQSH